MKASDLFIKCLENENIEYIFGVPGEENADFLISLKKSKKIKFILTRHEQSAAFMAEAYGKLTGKISCCLSTLGPGATNLLTGVADANMDHSPVLVITGQGSTNRLHKESHQIMDVCGMFDPVTKWTTSIRNPNTIPEIIAKAVRLATIEKPGAVHVELPEDIAKVNIKQKPLTFNKIRRAVPDDKICKEAFDLIAKSKSPIIIAGNGSIRRRASKQLRKFCSRSKIPLVTTFMGKGAIDFRSEEYIGTIGLGATDYGDLAVEHADLVITIGFDMVEYHPKLWNKRKTARIIHIDFEPSEVDEFYSPQVEIVGDIAHAIWKLNSYSNYHGIKKFSDKYHQKIRHLNSYDINRYSSDDSENLIKPQKFLSDLRSVMNKKDILISDVGAHKMWIARNFQCYEPNTCIVPNGFCSMGFALPATISCALSGFGRKIFAIAGDAGFMMNVHEMETAKRLNSDITVIIWEDNSYGLIKWKQENQFGETSDLDFDNPNWDELSKSFGWNYFEESQSKNLKRTLKEIYKRKGPNLLLIPIDYSENYKLTQKLSKLRLPKKK